MKSIIFLIFLAFAFNVNAQSKRQQLADLKKTYVLKCLEYDSLRKENSNMQAVFDELLIDYNKEQNKLKRSFETASLLRSNALSKFQKLKTIDKTPIEISMQQIDTIRIYKISDVRRLDLSALYKVQQHGSPFSTDLKKSKKEQIVLIQKAIEVMEGVNKDVKQSTKSLTDYSKEMPVLSEEMNRLSLINDEKSKQLDVLDRKLEKLLLDSPYSSEEERFGVAAISPPPPPPLTIEDEKVHTYVDEPAGFPGGTAALLSYLQAQIQYPESAKKAGIEGKAYLKFVVSKYGNISNVSVLRGVPDCPECDAEAVRVVKAMPQWIPGKIQGKAVNSVYHLPVKFQLPK